MSSSPRPAQPQAFMALSELDHRGMGAREWLKLLPAILLSVILNAIFLSVLVVVNPSSVRADNKLKNANQDDLTQIEEKNADEKTTIDLFMPEFNLPKDLDKSEKLSMPTVEPPELDAKVGLTNPPPEKTAIGGAGTGEDAKMRGNDALGAEALRGDPILAEMGGVGSGGSLPLGGGAGLNTGGGGGSNKSGGFGLRSGDLSTIAKRMGGSDESERAVSRALLWLRMHQAADGRWSLHKYHTLDKRCNCQSVAEKEATETKNRRNPGIEPDDVAATAMGVLPFLAAGHHHLGQKEESRIVRQALQFLLSRQLTGLKEDGKFDSDNFTMYTQGLATIAVCEAYGMTNDPKLRDAATRAVKFIVMAQNTQKGGWRYVPNTDSDTSVVGWQVMALKSAQMSNLPVPAQTLENAARFLDLAQYKEKRGGKTLLKYAYTVNNNDIGAPASPATTAAGLLSRLYMGWGPRQLEMIQGCDCVMEDGMPAAVFQKGQRADIYAWYYAAQVMHHMGGEYWQKWNPRMREYLIKSQEREGHKAGSWDPTDDAMGRRGGRIYTTALSALTLEVYYRHLPLYRREKLDKESNEEAARKQAEADKKPVSTVPMKGNDEPAKK